MRNAILAVALLLAGCGEAKPPAFLKCSGNGVEDIYFAISGPLSAYMTRQTDTIVYFSCDARVNEVRIWAKCFKDWFHINRMTGKLLGKEHEYGGKFGKKHFFKDRFVNRICATIERKF